MIKIFVVVLLFAWPAWAQDEAPEKLPMTGCGPANVKFELKTDKKQHPMGQAESGKALIYIFGDESRDPEVSYIGGGQTVQVGVDGAWMGATQYRSYFFFPLGPGGHRMCVAWQSSIANIARIRTATSFRVEAGGVYYFRIVSERRQKREISVKIEPLDEAEGALLITAMGLGTSQLKK